MAILETRTGLVMYRSLNSQQNPDVPTIDASQPETLGQHLPNVDFYPVEIVRYQTAHWFGLHLKTVQIISYEQFKNNFQEQCHLLVAGGAQNARLLAVAALHGDHFR
jgi:hypothetical protein